jgi:hypothetical protein
MKRRGSIPSHEPRPEDEPKLNFDVAFGDRVPAVGYASASETLANYEGMVGDILKLLEAAA